MLPCLSDVGRSKISIFIFSNMTDKQSIRNIIKERFKNLTDRELLFKSQNIVNQLIIDPEFINAKNILTYWPLPDEVDIQSINLSYFLTKTIFLPVIEGDNMGIKKFWNIPELEKERKFGIFQPIGTYFIDYELIDLIIVPGRAFDKSGNRVGRGKAYYDRFLSKLSVSKIGVCFDFQVFDYIPVDEHDIKMNKIIYA